MPSDMAMHKPRAWIIRFESDDEISTCGQQSDVSAGWIVSLDMLDRFAGDISLSRLGEERKVVAVQVDGVRDTGDESIWHRFQIRASNDEFDPCLVLVVVLNDDQVVIPIHRI